MTTPLNRSIARLLSHLKQRKSRNPTRSTPLRLESLEARQMLAFTDAEIALPGVSLGVSTWGDYDADGDLDLFIAGSAESGSIAQLWNNDGGTFTEVAVGQFQGVGNHPSADWGDIDADGDLDLVYAGPIGSARASFLYRNDGGNNFSLVDTDFLDVYRSITKFADIDSDGDIDLLVTGRLATTSVPQTQFYLNDGNGTFTAGGQRGVPGFQYSFADFADYDRDGDLDLLINGTTLGGAPDSTTRIYRNDGGTFTDISAGMRSTYRGSAQWADFDADGDLDVVATGRTNRGYSTHLYVYENVDGVFAERLDFDVSQYINETAISGYDASMSVGDFDNDGDLDIIATYRNRDETIVLQNGGNFSFTEVNFDEEWFVNFGSGTTNFVDFDRDGDLDVFLTGIESGTFYGTIFENTPDNSVANQPPVAPMNLVASQNQGVVTLTWTAPTDDITASTSLRYEIRVGTTPGGFDVVSPEALLGTDDGFRKTLGLGQYGLSGAQLRNLVPGQTYYWSVQAIDHGHAGSPFAVEASFVYDTTAPTLLSFTRQSPTSENTTASVLVFRATFDEPVTGIDVSDFVVSGGSTATVTSVTSADGGAGLLWDITVSGGDLSTYEGIVGLDLAAAQNITDLAQNPLPADEPATDETYTRANIAVVPIVVSGAATGEDTIRVFHAVTGELLGTISPFPGFTGGVHVALADLNGDDVAEIIAAAGPGGGPHVRIFDGQTLAQIDGPLGSFFAYDAAFTGGVYVAAGDVDDDGQIDIITGAGAGGGPHVKVFSGDDGSELMSFFAYDEAFRGGVSVAAGDVNHDFHADIITGAGPGGGPHVKVFSGDGGNELMSFFAYDTAFTGGVFVASGDVNNDFHADIITGAGPGGGPHVKVFSGLDQSVLVSFMAYDADDAATPEVEPTFTGGVYVASLDINDDDRDDIVTGAGPGGGPHVRVFDAITLDDLTVDAGYYTVDADYRFGATVAGEVREREPASA